MLRPRPPSRHDHIRIPLQLVPSRRALLRLNGMESPVERLGQLGCWRGVTVSGFRFGHIRTRRSVHRHVDVRDHHVLEDADVVRDEELRRHRIDCGISFTKWQHVSAARLPKLTA